MGMTEKTATPTETLMRAMESFGELEPKFAIVIYVAEDGTLAWFQSEVSTHQAVGALELVKEQIKHDWLEAK